MAGAKEEEVWRVANTAKGRDVKLGAGGGSHRPPSLSPAAKARLGRIVNRAPEVMVKVTGRTRGVTHLKSHLDYVTRNARLEAETHTGEPIRDRARLRALHDDWLQANAALARRQSTTQAPQSVGLILSMPPGTPRDRVEAAARSWARETFTDKHDWIMVRHNDRDHPHVHVTVRAVGSDGRRLAPGPEDLQLWRERFARELRRLGVEAEATPRQARGKVRRSERTPVHQVERRGAEPAVWRFQRNDATRAARAPTPPQPREWHRDIQARQDAIRCAFLAHADELERGDAGDRRLAHDVRRFVADMPVPLTRRQALATELRHVLERHPERVAPSSGMPEHRPEPLPRLDPEREPDQSARKPERRR